MFQAIEAARERVKIMVGLAGVSGSGKTYSALQLAYGLTGDWSKVAVIDTENRSSLYYAGERTGPWRWIDFASTVKDGYHPNNWIAAIRYAESLGVEALILDSITHEWDGTGGCLELVEKIGNASNKGNKFTAWNKVTPLHKSFIDRMRESPLHIVATLRSKSDYVLEENDRGKQTPRKVGLKTIQREGTDYEFGVILNIDLTHNASSEKDRTGLFASRPPFQITKETGAEFLQWANAGGEKLKPQASVDDASCIGKAPAQASPPPRHRAQQSREEIWAGTPHQLTWLQPYLLGTYNITHLDDIKSISADLVGTPKSGIGKRIKEIIDQSFPPEGEPAPWEAGP